MKAKDLQVGQWYFIESVPSPRSKGKFVGPAEFIRKDSFYNENDYVFLSPLNVHGEMVFPPKSVKHPCDPLPSYQELYKERFGVDIT